MPILGQIAVVVEIVCSSRAATCETPFFDPLSLDSASGGICSGGDDYALNPDWLESYLTVG
jgi:hypothetical protein